MLKELMNRKFYAELSEGEHEATLKSWEFVENATDHTKDYLKLAFSVNNHGENQPFTRNFFERDVSIMLSHLRRQLERTTEAIEPTKFFDALIAKKETFKLWIAYPVVPTARGLERKQNVNFLPPLKKVEVEEDTSDNAELPVGMGV